MKVTILNPQEQLLGKTRLLDLIAENLERDDLDEFRIAVAFAKIAPMLRMEKLLKEWKQKGRKIKAIFGIDHLGTSEQALEFALERFSEVFIVHTDQILTFHPKIYWFLGPEKGTAFIGSHNLTTGGTEINWEGGVRLDYDNKVDAGNHSDLHKLWDDLLPVSMPVSSELIDALKEDGLLLDERVVRGKHKQLGPLGYSKAKQVHFPRLKVRPPRALPSPSTTLPKAATTLPTVPTTKIAFSFVPTALIIQIVPHHNGEIFLSKIAVNQKPEFFGWPFTGLTRPKKSSNTAYPQRVPDPVVNITVFDKSGNTVVLRDKFALNTVYYANKSEIRITVPPEIVTATPPFSIMTMKLADPTSEIDYDIEIHPPNSPQFQLLLSRCTVTLPSGGKEKARKFGWI